MSLSAKYADVPRQKQEQRLKAIPSDWRFPGTFDSPVNVMSVPETCGILSPKEIEITGQNDAVSIVRKIASRAYTAKEVTLAFCKRAAIAQQLVNCLTEILFDEAIERAEALDREQSENPTETLRPLHGLPVSVKDCFCIPGYDATCGLVALANQPDSEHSALLKLLLDQGAVLYCKTNVPQTMMTADSQNNVFGRTLNPHMSSLTAGGSSGGEGALIALRGSLLGVGTDIAGSVRIPAMCCGIYAVRPSVAIVPKSGQKSRALPGTEAPINSIVGPLATSLRACDMFMRVVVDGQPWKYDLECQHRTPWRRIVSKPHTIRVGVARTDGLFTPWPPVKRALDDAVAKLRDAGFDLVDVELPDGAEVVRVALGLFTLEDGSKSTKTMLDEAGEDYIASFKRSWQTDGKGSAPLSSLQDYWALRHARTLVKETYQKFWLDHRLDAIIMPNAPTTATSHDMWLSATFTMLWNVLDYPAITIPTGSVMNTDLTDDIDNAIYGQLDRENYQMYTGPENFQGVPLSVQLVGMHQEDDQLMEIAEQVQLAFHQ